MSFPRYIALDAVKYYDRAKELTDKAIAEQVLIRMRNLSEEERLKQERDLLCHYLDAINENKREAMLDARGTF
jgi:hypothetical protein